MIKHIKNLSFREDIKRSWASGMTNPANWSKHLKLKRNQMSVNLLILYEIADRAARVKSKKAFKEFKQWVHTIMVTYPDAAIERVANMHLFRLKEEFSF